VLISTRQAAQVPALAGTNAGDEKRHVGLLRLATPIKPSDSSAADAKTDKGTLLFISASLDQLAAVERTSRKPLPAIQPTAP
jgi:hypothetical protein